MSRAREPKDTLLQHMAACAEPVAVHTVERWLKELGYVEREGTVKLHTCPNIETTSGYWERHPLFRLPHSRLSFALDPDENGRVSPQEVQMLARQISNHRAIEKKGRNPEEYRCSRTSGATLPGR